MKLLLGLFLSLCVFSWAQEEADPIDRLACLDEHQKSQPIPDHAFCVNGELYVPFEGFNSPFFDPTPPSQAQTEAMMRNYQQAYDALLPWEQELVDEGRLRFDGINSFNVIISPRVSRNVDTPVESEK